MLNPSKNHHIAQVDDMTWEPHVMGESIRKVLDLDADRDSYVHYRYVPPGGAPEGRRLHLSINETFFFLGGDLPSWEFDSAHDHAGHVIDFNAGTFMDRMPFSIHGRRPQPPSRTGSTLLIWTSGGGEFEADPVESIQIPFTGKPPTFDAPFTKPTVIDSRAIKWEAHPLRTGWRWRPLSTIAASATTTERPVSLVYIPPENHDVLALAPAPRRSWVFVLSGGLGVEIDGQSADLKENTYMRWNPGVTPILPNNVSPVGCTLLCVGHDLSTG
ncbi:MAG: hypothetical protein RID42_01920 [Alphaproteobacteria bacterium]